MAGTVKGASKEQMITVAKVRAALPLKSVARVGLPNPGGMATTSRKPMARVGSKGIKR